MSLTYAERKRGTVPAQNKEAEPQPTLDALRTGAAMPTPNQKGRPIDLPDAMREKM